MQIRGIMKRKARLWVGVTLLILIAFNYLVIGIPLYKRMNLLDSRIKAMIKNSEDNYIVNILKKEEIDTDRKIVILNCSAASAAIIVISWLAYGFIIYRKRGG